jgi:hypothetical protein
VIISPIFRDLVKAISPTNVSAWMFTNFDYSLWKSGNLTALNDKNFLLKLTGSATGSLKIMQHILFAESDLTVRTKWQGFFAQINWGDDRVSFLLKWNYNSMYKLNQDHNLANVFWENIEYPIWISKRSTQHFQSHFLGLAKMLEN